MENIETYGTGSKPPLQKGWQRKIRHIVSRIPFITPYFSTASMA